MNEVFNIRYKQLNKAQKEAVDTIEGPVMVIAGPGTGKTTILTLRIANILLKTDTPPSGILAITYTDAGVKAMRTKLREVIDARADEVKIYTFHSFSASIIAELGEHFPHLVGSKQMTEVDMEVLIRKILKDNKFDALRPFGNPDLYVGSIVRTISEAKHEAFTPEKVVEFAHKEIKRIKNDDGSISTKGATKGQLKADSKKMIEKCEKTILFAEVYRLYEERKRAEKRMDYDDLILELLVAFEKDELLLRLIQERFLYIHVDEHQDTNDSQNLLISMLANFFDIPNIFIVGDEKQAIYRFQGASVENFLRFQHLWKEMKIISLETNYRSHQSILDASFSSIENNYDENEHKNLRIHLSSETKHKRRPIDILSAPDNDSLDSYLVTELKSILKSDKKATVAIIVRRNRELDHLLTLLGKNEILVSSERKIDIFSHPVGVLFFDLIEFIADPTRTDLLAKTIISGLWNIPFDNALICVQEIRSGRLGKIAKMFPQIVSIKKELLNDAPIGFLIHVAQVSGYSGLIMDNPLYVEVWRAIVELAESICHENGIKSPQTLISALLAYRTSAETRNVKVSVGITDYPIHAMTAHGSKGLEFDYVFIPYASEESWIGRARGSHFVLPKTHVISDDIRDSRRLFYVALTRARKHVAILYSEHEAGGKELTPLRFIEELDKKHVSLSKLKFVPTLPETRHLSENNKSRQILDYAKQILLKKGLSVTALNHFIKCPNKFLYLSIIKLPQAPSPSAEKGNVMHDAFSMIWRSELRSKEVIITKISESIELFKKNSLLASFEKEAVVSELNKMAPIVANALATHFTQPGKIFSEEWSESTFDGSFSKNSLSITIHGRLDVIVANAKGIQVFDYKTKQAMSPASIKGETKSSDGSYFRQLVFYRLLLERDLRFKNKQIIPSLVFVSPDEKGRCPTITLPITNEDVKKIADEIQLLIENVWSGKILQSSCYDAKCEWCSLKKLMALS